MSNDPPVGFGIRLPERITRIVVLGDSHSWWYRKRPAPWKANARRYDR